MLHKKSPVKHSPRTSKHNDWSSELNRWLSGKTCSAFRKVIASYNPNKEPLVKLPILTTSRVHSALTLASLGYKWAPLLTLVFRHFCKWGNLWQDPAHLTGGHQPLWARPRAGSTTRAWQPVFSGQWLGFTANEVKWVCHVVSILAKLQEVGIVTDNAAIMVLLEALLLLLVHVSAGAYFCAGAGGENL